MLKHNNMDQDVCLDLESHIFDGERLEDLQCGGMKIIQNPKYFCFGVDAVLLSDFCRVKAGETVVDLGTGTGVIPLLLSVKTLAKQIVGLEVQKACVEMAIRSVSLNRVGDRVSIVEGDIKNVKELFPANMAHVIVSNPPYMKKGAGKINASEHIANARHEILCDLDDIMKAASWLIKPSGRFYMVHRPQRLADIICSARKHWLEPKQIQYVCPYDRTPPILVLMEFIKGGSAHLKTLAPLILYEEDGAYSAEMRGIYGLD
jgi:tRNA1(Val) A37 N6-methylase TrmN6